MSLYESTFYSSEANELLSDKTFIAQMLRVEASLATAQASVGHIPEKEAQLISACCNLRFIDIDKLKADIKLGGNAAIPLVNQLTKIVKTNDFEASKYVHLGATSQDIIDTATVLQFKEFIKWLRSSLQKLEKALYTLTVAHRTTVMIGRTLLQQAKPITFGLKTAGWLQSIRNSMERLSDCEKRLLKVQLSGAVGSGNTHLSLPIRKKFAELLDLSDSSSWQANRDNLNEFAAVIGILSGSLGKIAKDISLMMQTEIGETLEGAAEGKGGSSTMPHKRNPVTCALIIANCTRTPHLVSTLLSAMPQEHERSAGLWHAEWESMNSLLQLTAGSLEKSIDLLTNLEVNKARMLENMELTKGLIYAENLSLALAQKIGKVQAHELVEKACKTAIKENLHLKEVASSLNLGLGSIDNYFQPENSIGNSIEVIDEILKK